MKPESINIASLAAHYSDEKAAWKFMEELRWPNGPICPHCGVVDNAHLINTKERRTRSGSRTHRREWTCQDCKQQFSVLVGTIYESSHVPLFKWLLAQHMMCSNKNGVAALEIKRTLNVAYKTAWFICHRIREAMNDGPLADALKLKGTVESDETYIGGHLKGQGRGKGAYMKNKTAVVTLVERGGNRTFSGNGASPRVERCTIT
jgi:transposase-like protein